MALAFSGGMSLTASPASNLAPQTDFLAELIAIADACDCGHDHHAAPVAPAPTAKLRRYCYRCTDCLAVFFVEGAELPHLECACGGKVESMGRVYRDRLVTESIRCACDSRCTGARGPSCNCKCGGENHGSNAVVTVVTDHGAVPKALNKPDLKRGAEYRAAVDAALGRMRSRWGVWVDDVACGRWIDSRSAWSEIRYGLQCIRHARGLRTQSGRIRALALVAPSH